MDKVIKNLDDNQKNTRSLAFDMLRICAMIMVTLLHITGHGIATATIPVLSASYWVVLFVNSFSLVAVNCFVLITGYFLSSSVPKPKKLISLWIQVWMYSVGIYLVLCSIPHMDVQFNIKTLIRFGLPILSNQYWFVKCYFLLYLISPAINVFINAIDQKTFQKTLAVLLLLFCIVPSINIFGDTFGTNAGYSLMWFVVLYLVAAYLKRYPIALRFHPLWMYLGSCFVLCMFRLAGDLLGSIIKNVANLQSGYNGPLVFLASIGLLLCCARSNGYYKRPMATMIHALTALVFGVYLLHDHGLLSKFLWNDWVKLSDVANLPLAFCSRIAIVLVGICVVGITVEWIRVCFVKVIGKLINRTKSKM